MRRLALFFALTLSLAPLTRAEKARKPKPALPADKYPQHDEHPKEHVTIAAEPGDVKETEPDTRLDYAHHGFLPIRVIVTNDSDKTVSLDDARITLITADNTVIPAATDEELQRRLFSSKSAAPTKIPLPAPLPSITIHHKPVDQKILADENDFGFKSTAVEPHTTAAGYLYYDVRRVDDPVLDHATLELRRVHPADSKQDFYSFEIALKPTPEAPKSATPSKPGAKKESKDPKDSKDAKATKDSKD